MVLQPYKLPHLASLFCSTPHGPILCLDFMHERFPELHLASKCSVLISAFFLPCIVILDGGFILTPLEGKMDSSFW